ncbi:MAG: epoxyqueuosine reductase QueH, partial [Lachnospiraceae bacterium]|nr:epoxyqueuosine reductase QueH [Lachnospiraceae bacterium]
MNKRDFQKELDGIIKEIEESGIRPKLLLHVCCAPCSSYCMEYLTKYFDMTLLFYNPNMDSSEEYEKRKAELLRLVKEAGFPVK